MNTLREIKKQIVTDLTLIQGQPIEKDKIIFDGVVRKIKILLTGSIKCINTNGATYPNHNAIAKLIEEVEVKDGNGNVKDFNLFNLDIISQLLNGKSAFRLPEKNKAFANNDTFEFYLPVSLDLTPVESIYKNEFGMDTRINELSLKIKPAVFASVLPTTDFEITSLKCTAILLGDNEIRTQDKKVIHFNQFKNKTTKYDIEVGDNNPIMLDKNFIRKGLWFFITDNAGDLSDNVLSEISVAVGKNRANTMPFDAWTEEANEYFSNYSDEIPDGVLYIPFDTDNTGQKLTNEKVEITFKAKVKGNVTIIQDIYEMLQIKSITNDEVKKLV